MQKLLRGDGCACSAQMRQATAAAQQAGDTASHPNAAACPFSPTSGRVWWYSKI